MPKKRLIKYKKERMVLSDILPYELPLTFSNRYLYDFLIKNRIEYKEKNFFWLHKDHFTDLHILILLGLPVDTEIKIFKKQNIDYAKLKKSAPYMVTIPFTYFISHKNDQYRELSIIHPKNQIQAINFYDKFKELIIYFSSVSKFSLRAPRSIATCTYYDDKSKLQTFIGKETIIEEKDKEYKNLRSFFSYEKYSNIFKFYESKEFHRCEKLYNKMVKLDVSKCFDSIYTHTIAWAILTKQSVKEKLRNLDGSFADEFDKLMQQINYNETNGIVIGPEISRIFAELILQSIDNSLFRNLENQNIHFKGDYEIFRYVDDYFIFFNHDYIYDEILKNLQVCLKKFKLHLNTSKTEFYNKPIITNISIAKKQISNLLTDKIKYYILEKETEDGTIKNGNIYIKYNSLITDFKIILKITNVQYKDIINYSLSIVERKCRKIIRDYLLIEQNPSKDKELINAFLSILEFSFFIYSVTPRVNSTIKLIRILHQIILFLKNNTIGIQYEHVIYKMAFDNINFILRKNITQEYIQVETLYLLTFLPELGREYWLDLDHLAKYFCATKDNNQYTFEIDLNYLSISVVLFYMKNKKRYVKLKKSVLKQVKKKFQNKCHQLNQDTELTLLFFDILSCPYVSSDYKFELMSFFSINTPDQEYVLKKAQENIFSKWSTFDYAKELDSKKSLNVY